jgi:DNA-directed RNA polymerase subunit beta'
VKKGTHVKKGTLLTDGSADLHDLLDIAGFETAQEYIIAEIAKVYELNSSPVSRKHLKLLCVKCFLVAK